MSSPKQPISAATVAQQTEQLILQKKTDIERWKNHSSLAPQWDQRAAHAAKYIPDGSAVLDVGCGAMALEQCLGPQCIYHPADVVQRREGCLVVDLNRDEFPSIKVDVITFLGVLEYVFDLEDVFKKARVNAGRLIFSYCIPTEKATAYRRGLGWVNEFSEVELNVFLNESGWNIQSTELNKTGPNSRQIIFVCEAAQH